uniref:Ferritin n=1 Tax=Plectus sambesii TaxID=2011161 RepID=A0A914UP13_9BILA
MSQIRQNYHQDTENAVNQQISLALHASYTYLSIAYHFDRDDVALANLHKFFMKLSDDKKEQANKCMKYQNTRGGRVVLQPVQKPTQDVWGSTADAFQSALDLEKMLNQVSG